MLTVKYTWRELSQDGLLKRIVRSYSWRNDYFDSEFYSEQEAIDAFKQEFEDRYEYPKFVLVKLYGTESTK